MAADPESGGAAVAGKFALRAGKFKRSIANTALVIWRNIFPFPGADDVNTQDFDGGRNTRGCGRNTRKTHE